MLQAFLVNVAYDNLEWKVMMTIDFLRGLFVRMWCTHAYFDQNNVYFDPHNGTRPFFRLSHHSVNASDNSNKGER